MKKTAAVQDNIRHNRKQATIPDESWAQRLYRMGCAAAFPFQSPLANAIARLSSRGRVDRHLNPFNNFRTSPFYRRMLAAETRYWANPLIGRHDSVHDNPFHPQRGPNLSRYWNESTTGSPEKTWFEFVRERGPYRRVLCLGLFPELPKFLKSGLADEWVINDLTRRENRESSEISPSVKFINEDLNFSVFPENHFDLVICHDVLHHIIRLEHLAGAVNRTLTKDGIFAVIDYVGENRFLWDRPKKIALNNFLRYLPPSAARFPFASEASTQFIPLSPFEAVRSIDIMPVLDQHFRRQEVRYLAPMLFPLLTYLKEAFLKNDNAVIDRLILADRGAADWNIRPSFVAGIFAKK